MKTNLPLTPAFPSKGKGWPSDFIKKQFEGIDPYQRLIQTEEEVLMGMKNNWSTIPTGYDSVLMLSKHAIIPNLNQDLYTTYLKFPDDGNFELLLKIGVVLLDHLKQTDAKHILIPDLRATSFVNNSVSSTIRMVRDIPTVKDTFGLKSVTYLIDINSNIVKKINKIMEIPAQLVCVDLKGGLPEVARVWELLVNSEATEEAHTPVLFY